MAPRKIPYSLDTGLVVKKSSLPGLFLLGAALTATAQTPVSVAPLSELAVYPDRFAPATVISLNEPLISAQITAQIDLVPVRVGDMVEAGDTLVELDCTEYELGRESAQASLESAEAQYEQAKNNLERAQSLVSNQLISVENLESSQTSLDTLSASARAARASLELNRLYESRCDIKAPFDALVLDRMASVGQLATPGTPIASILDLSSLEISAQIFSGDADQFNQGLELYFESNGNHYPVEINNLVEALNSTTRNREARLNFVNESALPGSSGKIYWSDPRPHLPPDYAVERDGNLGFFVAEGQRARFQILQGAQQGRSNPVYLPLSTQVIVEGYAGLSDGDIISVSN